MCQLQRLLYELSSLPVYLMWQEWRFYFPSAVRRRFHDSWHETVNHSGIAALQWKLPQPSILPIAKRWPTFLGIKITYDRNVGTMHWKAAVEVWHGRLQLFEDTYGENFETWTGDWRFICRSLPWAFGKSADMCYPVGFLSRFQQQPVQQRWIALKQTVRHLEGSRNAVLVLQTHDRQLWPHHLMWPNT